MRRLPTLVGSFIAEHIDFSHVAANELVRLKGLQIKTKTRALARGCANSLDFDGFGDAESGEFADTLSPEKGPPSRSSISLAKSSVAPYVEIAILTILEGHSIAVVDHFNFSIRLERRRKVNQDL